VRHKADLVSLICRTRSDQTVVLKQKSRVELGLQSKSAVQGKVRLRGEERLDYGGKERLDYGEDLSKNLGKS